MPRGIPRQHHCDICHQPRRWSELINNSSSPALMIFRAVPFKICYECHETGVARQKLRSLGFGPQPSTMAEHTATTSATEASTSTTPSANVRAAERIQISAAMERMRRFGIISSSSQGSDSATATAIATTTANIRSGAQGSKSAEADNKSDSGKKQNRRSNKENISSSKLKSNNSDEDNSASASSSIKKQNSNNSASNNNNRSVLNATTSNSNNKPNSPRDNDEEKQVEPPTKKQKASKEKGNSHSVLLPSSIPDTADTTAGEDERTRILTSVPSNHYGNPRERVKWVKFSESECKNVIQGLKNFGVGKWSKILAEYEFHPCRTNLSIKDKYRTLLKQGLIQK